MEIRENLALAIIVVCVFSYLGFITYRATKNGD